MAAHSPDDVACVVISNATPFLWNLSRNEKQGMKLWNFPKQVQPGQTITAKVDFGGAKAHGEACYEVEVEEGQSGDGNPTFTIKANHDGIIVVLPQEIKSKQGQQWFAVPSPPCKVADSGWQKGCPVSFTLGALGGEHPNLRGGHTIRGFGGQRLAALNPPPSVGPESRSRAKVLPDPDPAPKSSDRGAGGGGGMLGGFGRLLQEVSEGVGGLLNDCTSGENCRPSGGKGEGDWTQEWMKMCRPAIEGLKLSQLSIPGTHDSATAKMHNPVVGPWASTQKLSLGEQLLAGVRALDLRCGFVGEGSTDVDDGVAVVHDVHRTSISLRNACLTVKSFVKQHPSEVVLLDFHRFPSLDHGPPHEHAAKVVLEVMQDVMIDPKHRNLPFGKLLKEQQGRVAVLWNAVEARNPLFWPGVKQEWNGAETVGALHDLANGVLAAKRANLWSLPLVLPAGVPRPVPHIPAHLDDWVAVGGVWQDNSSIIAVDFVEETQVVRNCVGACLLKAARAGATAPAHGGGGGGGGGKVGGGGKGGGGAGGGNKHGHKK